MDYALARRSLFVTFAALLVLGCGTTGSHSVANKPFPVTHVTLYDCGLAQMERQTEVHGGQRFIIKTARAHLDDLLATLFLRSQGRIQVQSMRYPSVRNRSQALASSGIGRGISGDNEVATRPGYLSTALSGFVGTHVELQMRNGKTIAGVLLTFGPVSNGAPTQDGQPKPSQQRLVASLVTDEGELLWVDLDELAGLKPSSGREAKALQELATSLGESSGFSESVIEIETGSDSNGTLAAGYVRQIPIWRMAYRLTAQNDQLLMEAYAVVHNDTEEDWNQIGITLLSGAPASYVLSMASPRYVHREPLQLADGAEMQPQLGAETPDDILYEMEVTYAGFAGRSASGAYSVGYGSGGGSGASYGSGAIGYVSPGDAPSSLLSMGEVVETPESVAEVEKEISTYSALSATSIPAGSSGLVPIMSRKLPGRLFTRLNAGLEAHTCTLVDNDTGLVLQPGLATVYIDGRFRGQMPVDRMQPGERVTWCFGADMDVSAESSVKVKSEPKVMTWVNGILWLHSVVTETRSYTVKNHSGQARNAAVEIVLPSNSRLVSPEGTLVGGWGEHYVLLSIPAREEQGTTVVIEKGVQNQIPLSTASLLPYKDNPEVPESSRGPLAALWTLLSKIEVLRLEIAQAAGNMSELQDRSARVKDDLRAIPPGAAGGRAVQQMVEDLSRIEAGIRRVEETIKQKDKEIEELTQQISGVLRPLEPKKTE